MCGQSTNASPNELSSSKSHFFLCPQPQKWNIYYLGRLFWRIWNRRWSIVLIVVTNLVWGPDQRRTHHEVNNGDMLETVQDKDTIFTDH